MTGLILSPCNAFRASALQQAQILCCARSSHLRTSRAALADSKSRCCAVLVLLTCAPRALTEHEKAEDGIRDFCLSRGLGDVYKRQVFGVCKELYTTTYSPLRCSEVCGRFLVGFHCFCFGSVESCLVAADLRCRSGAQSTPTPILRLSLMHI